jgi:hypothetical protein
LNLKGIRRLRHSLRVRTILALLLLAVTCLRADDRADIDHLIGALNDAKDEAAVRTLCTSDAPSVEIARFGALHTSVVASADRIWSERMPPHLAVSAVRFITHDVALVDAADRQIGTLPARSTPWLLILRRGTDGWRVASLRTPSNVTQGDRLPKPF